MPKVAFIDRDGTIIWEPPQPKAWDPRETYTITSLDQFKFLDGALDGMKSLADKGYKLVLVTNQTYLGRPKNPRQLFDKVMAKIKRAMNERGIEFDFIMICPHGPDDGCVCRKPKTGGLDPYFKKYDGQI